MRVISGKAKGRKLKMVPGDTTRPIMDRVKENLFNILGQFVPGSTWLDLFAGTGQVGIEALSRGAAHVVFVDKVSPAIRTIKDNLRTTRLEGDATVLQRDAYRYLENPNRAPFDLIYVAPPQYREMWADILAIIDARPGHYMTPDGLVVVQIDPKEARELELQNLELIDERRYGSTMLLFYELPLNVT
ncbi:MAG: 16S rRNA (guanine(966)-N(2))-methyltransferase RsmD [Candidatus Promineifilaceae bacterium]